MHWMELKIRKNQISNTGGSRFEGTLSFRNRFIKTKIVFRG